MTTLFLGLCALACPLGMLVMMLWMRKGHAADVEPRKRPFRLFRARDRGRGL